MARKADVSAVLDSTEPAIEREYTDGTPIVEIPAVQSPIPVPSERTAIAAEVARKAGKRVVTLSFTEAGDAIVFDQLMKEAKADRRGLAQYIVIKLAKQHASEYPNFGGF
jgi:hypothetical protein